MKREIKFRAWDIYQNKMLDWNDCCNSNKLTLSNLLNDLIAHIKPMQFTGLKDSNGTEIYEGDIIHQLSNPDWHSKVDNKYIVEFGNQDLGHSSYQQTIGWNATDVRYIGKDYTKSKGILDLCLNHSGIKAIVIGNIHENPELL